jgi:hypothetical protein
MRTPKKKRRTMSPEARARISAAMKLRHAKLRRTLGKASTEKKPDVSELQIELQRVPIPVPVAVPHVERRLTQTQKDYVTGFYTFLRIVEECAGAGQSTLIEEMWEEYKNVLCIQRLDSDTGI